MSKGFACADHHEVENRERCHIVYPEFVPKVGWGFI
jgi:hypothetical protein